MLRPLEVQQRNMNHTNQETLLDQMSGQVFSFPVDQREHPCCVRNVAVKPEPLSCEFQVPGVKFDTTTQSSGMLPSPTAPWTRYCVLKGICVESSRGKFGIPGLSLCQT